MNNEMLWKIYWWGNHRDAAFIESLNCNTSLYQLLKEREWDKGQGYTPGNKMPAGWLQDYNELTVKSESCSFHRYGIITDDHLINVPDEVHRQGKQELYSGWRLLVKRGITQANNSNGRIESRLDDKTFCFRNSVHAIRMDTRGGVRLSVATTNLILRIFAKKDKSQLAE
jgi:hypothetical protein